MTRKMINGRYEYREIIKHSCGHEIENVTYGYKMTRKEAEHKKRIICGRCWLKEPVDCGYWPV